MLPVPTVTPAPDAREGIARSRPAGVVPGRALARAPATPYLRAMRLPPRAALATLVTAAISAAVVAVVLARPARGRASDIVPIPHVLVRQTCARPANIERLTTGSLMIGM